MSSAPGESPPVGKAGGIPRNQIVRAERGDNITIDTVRRIAANLPVRELTLIDTKGLRGGIVAEPEKLFNAALENVMMLTEALRAAIVLAMQAGLAAEVAWHVTAALRPDGGEPTVADPLFALRALERLADEIQQIGRTRRS